MHVGDHVNLLMSKQVVGEGTIHSNDPLATCHFVTLGADKISVVIKKALAKNMVLPYPTEDASTMEEAIGSFVLWNRQEIALVGNPRLGLGRHEKTRGTRVDWINEKVKLWSIDHSKIVAKGYILLAFPNDAFEFGELGDEHVGVTISQTYEGIQAALEAEQELCDMNVGLLKWPINQVTFDDGEKLILIDDCNSVELELQNETFGNTHDEENMQEKKKRPYKMINRRSSSENTNSKRPKFDQKLSTESIFGVSSHDCCKRGCCQHVDRKKIEEARRQYWGQNSTDRVNYVLDMFQTSQQKHGKLKGFDMAFNGKVVCAAAWYRIHGIPKASFHRYKASYDQGAMKVCHGNMGIIRKAWDHVEMAKAILHDFVQNNADQMPHRSRTTTEGERETQLVLSGLYKQQDILREVNMTLSSLQLKSISHSTLSRLWRTVFKHVGLCKASSFSKCDTCTSIKNALEATKVVEERAKLFMTRRVHMLAQMSCRNLYYSWKQRSLCEPRKYLCIIHDKMDQAKTATPRLDPLPKSLSHCKQLPISLTGMLTHGHGKGAYGHFALGYWPSGPDFTIGSLARCLRHLELSNEDKHGDVQCKNIPGEPIWKDLLSRNMVNANQNADSNEENVPLSESRSTANVASSLSEDGDFISLPRTLYLQLDNCGSENKNRYVFAFLSMLTAKGIFEFIHLGFLMVGHTHEDIDAMFSRFSEKLRTSQVYTFGNLMETFMKCSCCAPVPYLMQEIPDFKRFIDGYLCDGPETLIGHKKPLQFRFFLRDGIPIMQYMMNPRAKTWLPQDGIELWKRDANGIPMLPTGNPSPLPLSDTIKDQEYICQGIKKYIEWWTEGMNKKHANLEFKEFIQPMIIYWENILKTLKDGISQRDTYLKDGFWPRTRLMEDNVEAIMQEKLEEEDMVDEHYCGPINNKPKTSFKPHIDVKKDLFVLVRPSDENIYPIWLGVALTDVNKDNASTNHLKFLVQYWAPICRSNVSNEEERYRECWTKQWRCNLKDQERWEPASVVVWSWRSRKNPKDIKSIKIPSSAAQKAQANLSQDSTSCDDDVG